MRTLPAILLVFILAYQSGCGGTQDAAQQTPLGTAKGKPKEKAKPKAARQITNSVDMKLNRIEAGEFMMGSAIADAGGRDDERPQHKVQISQPFYMGVYEVTQGEFEKVLGINPSFYTATGPVKDKLKDLDTSRLPVDDVTWFQAIEFCRKLSQSPQEVKAGRVYRIPTEAEWEYACRAGTKTVFHYGDSLSSQQANFNGKYPFGKAKTDKFLNRTTTVGSYPPNAWGLYDMHGNLNEWCMDKFDRAYYANSPAKDPKGPKQGESPVIRGGDWYSDGRDCRSAFRYADIPEGRFYALGFRVVCELKSEGAKLSPIVAGAAKPFERGARVVAAADATKSAAPSSGEDWPKWRGVRGDGTWLAPRLPAKWPKKGLQTVWQTELGGGYGGIAVSGGRAYVMDRQRKPKDVERILCFDATTGKPLWSHNYPVDYAPVSYGNGPRATPTVHRGHIYTLGAVGHLVCFDVSGKVVWSKDLVKESKAKIPMWGLSASPVVFEDMVIVHPGAEPNGCYMAFDLRTGKERWRSLADGAGYATPRILQRNGTQQLVGWTPSHIRGLDPRSGKLLWSSPFVVNNGTALADPILYKDLVVVSSYYDGSQAIRLGKTAEPEVAWHDRRNLRGLMSHPLLKDGYAYLLDKRHGLTCFEIESGKKIWDDDNRLTPKGRNPQATLVWLNDGDRAIALNSDGDLVLLRLNPKAYQEDSRTNIIGRTWAHPAYAGNCVFARSDTEIVCVLLPK